MNEVIDKRTFASLMATGGIELSKSEAENLRRELNRQMSVIRQLEAIPLDDDIHPVIHGNPYPEVIRCGLREDIPCPFENSPAIIAQAPVSRDGFIISPDIPHQKIG